MLHPRGSGARGCSSLGLRGGQERPLGAGSEAQRRAAGGRAARGAMTQPWGGGTGARVGAPAARGAEEELLRPAGLCWLRTQRLPLSLAYCDLRNKTEPVVLGSGRSGVSKSGAVNGSEGPGRAARWVPTAGLRSFTALAWGAKPVLASLVPPLLHTGTLRVQTTHFLVPKRQTHEDRRGEGREKR